MAAFRSVKDFEAVEKFYGGIHRRGSPADQRELILARPWAQIVTRIVLLAGMNRGWRISHHFSFKHAIQWRAGTAIGYAIHLVTRRWLLIFKIRRGAEFITQLRIQWLQLRRCTGLLDPATGCLRAGSALTVQLLGSRDDMVAPEDNVDLVSGRDFVYLDVPYSGHADVIRLNDSQHGPGRAQIFRQALIQSPEELQQHASVPSDEKFSEPTPNIKNVVFVIHGIRDEGFWTHKIARRVRQRAASRADEWATETSSYGYFPMLPFLVPWYRRRKVEWLMDQYAEALARYPAAKFSYVGHSNGTYLLAKALELYPCARFENVVFAGSVVRVGYDWSRFLNATPPRVGAVLNFLATTDWVVAFFPKLFQFLGCQDLGSAGHDGFQVAKDTRGVFQARYVKGGHGAAIAEPVWDTIADFVLTGRANTGNIPNRVTEKNVWIDTLSKFPPLVWALILLVAFSIWAGITFLIGRTVCDPETRGLVTGLALGAYALFLWLIVTRV